MAGEFDDIFGVNTEPANDGGFDDIFGIDKKRTVGGTIKDVGVSAFKGAVGLGEAVVGLSNLATGGLVGKGMDKIGYDPQQTREVVDKFYSPAQQEANRKVQEAEGFIGTAKAYLQNPSTIGHALVETAPLMFGGGVAGGALMRGASKVAPKLIGGLSRPVAGAIAGGVGEGLITTGSMTEPIRQQTPENELTGKNVLASLGAGVGTGIFGAVGGRLAQKLGFADPDVMIATSSLAESVKQGGVKEVARRIIGGGITEGIFEELPQSVQETIWENAALDKPLLDGVPESAAQAIIVGSAMGAGANLLPRARGAEPGQSERPNFTGTQYAQADPIEKAFAKTKDTKPSDKDALSLISNPKYTNTVTPEQRPIYDDLVKRGLARNDGGTYSITDEGRKILGQERNPVDTKGMTGKEKQTIKALETKGKPSRLSDLKMDKEQKAAISSLMKKGIVRRNDNGTFELNSEDIAPESAERDLMYQFADTAQDVQDQADARTRAYRFEQMPGEIAWREQEQAAREYNQKRNERAANDTIRPNPDQLARVEETEAAPTGQEADTGVQEAATSQPGLEEMVADAARWKGAAMKVAQSLPEGDKKAALRHSKMTTKGDLDGYLMRKYGVDEATARQVSNELTSRNVPADMTSNVEDFSGEQWATPEAPPADTGKRKAPGTGQATGQVENTTEGATNEQVQGQAEEVAAPVSGDRAITTKDGRKEAIANLKEIGATVDVDNPGGQWLAEERSRAVKKDKKDGMRHGTVTAVVRKVELPVDELLKIPGMLGEQNRIEQDRVDNLAEDIKKNGLKYGPFINVGHDGTALVNEGNHRIRAAKKAGLKTIKVEISYFAGGERADGPLTLERVAEIASPIKPVTTEAPQGAEPEITGTPADQPGVGTVTEPSTKAAPATPPPKAEGAIEAKGQSQRSESAPNSNNDGFSYSRNDIPRELAYRAYYNTSFSPDKRAEQTQDGYVEDMKSVIDSLSKLATTEDQKADLVKWFNEYYRPGYVKRLKAKLEADSRTMSSMITGPANFPVARNKKRLDTADRRTDEWLEWSNNAVKKMRSKLRGTEAISSTDENAIEKLQKKLQTLEKNQETMKAANVIIRNKKITEDEKISKLSEIGIGEVSAKELLKPDFGNRLGFASYSLQNNNAEIKRIKGRIQELEKRKEKAETTGGSDTRSFDGGSVEMNYEDGFVRIYHDSKPSAEVRASLKKNGFRWSPRDTAWRRKITPDAQWKVRELTGLDFSKQVESESDDVMEALGSPTWYSRLQRIITPEMQQAALGEGMPLFSPEKGKATGTATLRELLNTAKREKGITGKLSQLLSDIVTGTKLDVPVIINPRASAPSYNPRTNTITVRDPEQYHTSLHEIVHAVTVNALRSDTQQARAVRQQLKALMRRVRAEVKKRGIISQELLDQVEAAKTSQNFKQMYPDHATNQIAYAFLNEYEFLAQAFSDKQFQSILKDIRMPAGSKFVRAWDAFIDTVMRVLGIKATHKDAFGEAVSIVAELAQMEKLPTSDFGNTQTSIPDSVGNGTFRNPKFLADIIKAAPFLDKLAGNVIVPTKLPYSSATTTTSLPLNSYPVGREATPAERPPDYVLRKTKLISNLLERDAVSSKGLGALNIKELGVVLSGMRSILHDREVFNSVIKLVPVDMVNDFVSGEFSPKMLLHDPSVFLKYFPADADGSVSMDSDIAYSFIRESTIIAAMVSARRRLGKSGITPIKNLSTEITGNLWHNNLDVLVSQNNKYIIQNLVDKSTIKEALFNPGKWNPANPDIMEAIEDTYAQYRATNRSIKRTAVSNLKKFTKDVLGGLDKALGASSTRLRNVSEKIEAKVRRLDYQTNTRLQKDTRAVTPLLEAAQSRMSRNDFADWNFARMNGDKEKIDKLVGDYKLEDEYQLYRTTLDRIRDEANNVGMDVGYIHEYAPRVIKDPQGFLNHLGRGDDWPIIYQRLQAYANKHEGMTVETMDPALKADIISNMLFGSGPSIGAPSNIKERKIKEVPADLAQYYMDSDAALMHYLRSMRKHIEIRNFFGKIPTVLADVRRNMRATDTRLRQEKAKDKPDQEKIDRYKDNIKEYQAILDKYREERDYTEHIGAYVLENLNDIGPDGQKTVVDVLRARFHEHGTRGIIQDYKNLSYIDTMGSPISALTQIGDLAWAVFENGWVPSLKAVGRSIRNKSIITKEDVGIDRIAQEFSGANALSKAVNFVFKAVGLEKIDSIGKETLLNGALEKFQKRAKQDQEALRKEIAPIFEIETDSVIDDLQSGEITDNVKLLVYSKLLDYQPVGLSEMPELYLLAGNGRIFYMLKTFTIKQFDVYRRQIYNKIKNGDTKEKIQGIRNMVYLASLFVMANAGADELKDLVLGRETTFEDRTVDNVLRLFGVSKYITWQSRTEGVGTAVAKQILPPFKFINSLYKDIVTAGDDKGLYTAQSLPIVGKLAYWHMGRGKDNRRDLWEIRFSKERRRLEKIKDKVERDNTLTQKYSAELRKLRRMNRLQSRANKLKSRINKMIDAERNGADYSVAKQRLQQRRIDMLQQFMEQSAE